MRVAEERLPGFGETDPEEQYALDVAYRYLGHRDRTVWEVRQYLFKKRVGPSAIERAIETLKSQGYLDDIRFVKEFARAKRLLDHWGRDRIVRRLAALGVDSDTMESTLHYDRQSELDEAVSLLEKRYQSLGDDENSRRRAIGLLRRRGYDSDTAYDALRSFERRY